VPVGEQVNPANAERLVPAAERPVDADSVTTESSRWIEVDTDDINGSIADSGHCGAESNASQGNAGIAMPASAMSTPPAISCRQCFPLDAQLLDAAGHVVGAASMQPQAQLQSVCDVGGELCFASVAVKAVRELPARDRDFIVSRVSSLPQVGRCGVQSSAVLTADHAILSGSRHDTKWSAIECSELVAGNHSVLAITGGCEDLEELETPIESIERETRSCPVVEIELEDARHAVLLSFDGVDCQGLFLAVFGSPPQPKMVAVWERRRSTLDVRVAGRPASSHELAASHSASDPTHSITPELASVYRTIRRPHDANCRAWCKKYFANACHRCAECPQCHHEDHYKDNHKSAPSHRGRRRKGN